MLRDYRVITTEDRIHPRIKTIAWDTFRYHVNQEELEFSGSLPIDIRLMIVESIFRRYNDTYDGNDDIFGGIFTSLAFVKEYIRAYIAASSPQPELFYKNTLAPKRGCCVSRYDAESIRGIVMDYVPDIDIIDNDKILRIMYDYCKSEMSNNMLWSKIFDNQVLLLDVHGPKLHVYSLGSIEAFRFKELTKPVIELNESNLGPDGRYYLG
jgi:hypothetical protein